MVPGEEQPPPPTQGVYGTLFLLLMAGRGKEKWITLNTASYTSVVKGKPVIFLPAGTQSSHVAVCLTIN